MLVHLPFISVILQVWVCPLYCHNYQDVLVQLCVCLCIGVECLEHVKVSFFVCVCVSVNLYVSTGTSVCVSWCLCEVCVGVCLYLSV